MSHAAAEMLRRGSSIDSCGENNRDGVPTSNALGLDGCEVFPLEVSAPEVRCLEPRRRRALPTNGGVLPVPAGHARADMLEEGVSGR